MCQYVDAKTVLNTILSVKHSTNVSEIYQICDSVSDTFLKKYHSSSIYFDISRESLFDAVEECDDYWKIIDSTKFVSLKSSEPPIKFTSKVDPEILELLYEKLKTA